MEYTLTLGDEAHEDVRKEIVAPLVEYNTLKAGPSQGRPIVVVVRDAADAIVGGLWGHTGYEWLFTQLLVVPEGLRGRGVGSELMRMAEAEAISRGCRGAWLDTFEFQARGFYERIGYECFAELPNYPSGFSRFFMKKLFEPGAQVRPNNSFNRTRYGKRRKPGLRHMVHHLSPGLRRLPPRAG